MPETWRIEVALDPGRPDPAGAAAAQDLAEAAGRPVESVRTVRVFALTGEISPADAERIARELLSDPVVDRYAVGRSVLDEAGARVIEIVRRPGVMDPVQASIRRGIAALGLPAVEVRTARKYVVRGALDGPGLLEAARRTLANEMIEELFPGPGGAPPEALAPRAAPEYIFRRVEVPLREAGDEQLLELSRAGCLSLNLRELQALREYFRRQGREPTDVELETLAQTWSEHCVHKTFRGLIRRADGSVIRNLLKSTIMRATRELDRPWCLSVFKDNSGVIRFDETDAVCFKVETHNHPSAIEPYGGAGTGIGGCIRDPLGTGLGARPIANTDVFCFAPPDLPRAEVPPGALHPRRIMRGVVAGVRDYGNRMGIPTVNGAIFFDRRYVGNPLVFCGNVGILPARMTEKLPQPGDRVVVVGGRTGRDGIHGATFSSIELTRDSETTSATAVQIGNAIEEKRMADVLLQARDRGLYHAVTDCGAGGLSSAVGEMGEVLGAEVDLEKVPLKYAGLSYTEIWISEAQERMVLAVPPERAEELVALFAAEDVEATEIGCFTGDGRLRLRYRGQLVGELEMEFLHRGLPELERAAAWTAPRLTEPAAAAPADCGAALKRILADWNVCSKEWVVRQYDHEVQAQTAIKPLVGAALDGPGDAAVLMPKPGSRRGIVLACGMNPRYGDLDPYWMAAAAIDEAVRNALAVGGSLAELALLDNFCWGNTEKPDRLGGLVRAAEACYDVAVAYGTPFISGKDSLNNEFALGDGRTVCIPPSLLISAIGVIEDVARCVTMDAKAAGDPVYLLGLTKDELGGSTLYALSGQLGANVPRVETALALKVFRTLEAAIAAGLVRACHDLSEGGLAAAAAESAFAGALGLELDVAAAPVPADAALPGWKRLFSESQSRFLLELAPKREAEFVRLVQKHGAPAARLGTVTERPRLVLRDGRKVLVDEALVELKEAWQKPLRW